MKRNEKTERSGNRVWTKMEMEKREIEGEVGYVKKKKTREERER